MPKKKYTRQTGKNQLPNGLLQYKLRKLFKDNAGKQFSVEESIKALKISNSHSHVKKVLEKFVSHGFLVRGKEGQYVIKKQESSKRKPKYFTGTVDMTKTGSAYILSDALKQDVHIARKYMNTALHGDTVEFELFYGRKRNRLEGKIIDVKKRANSQFMGTYKKYDRYAIVTVDRTKKEFEIFIDFDEVADARQNDKVIVEITEWRGKKNQVPWGKIIQSFGPNEDHDMEMNTILVNNGFSIDFPEEVMNEAEVLSDKISAEELARRKDFRKVTTFTIDPFNARDFDDALSIRKKENGHFEVGIHIADVTHFVRPGTALDKEAYDRSTSVYLVDRVCPMLPEKLSNELCSLRPNEDKYTFSAVFAFDEHFNIKKEWFGKTLIHSDRRFTYDEVQDILESGEGDFAEELELLNRIAKKLRKDKFDNGAISFESDEVTFILDEDGTPLEIVQKERKDAHMLVEDFMLLANKKVATFMSRKSKGKNIPFVYRIHDYPDPEKLQDFANFAKEMGFSMNVSTPDHVAASFNSLSAAASENERLKMLEPLALRTMAKAAYSTDNIGHYGLSFEYYTHFTSPIRRYADVMVHRILFKNLQDEQRMDKNKLESICVHISSQERKAIDAERESIKFKQVEFIIGHIGEEFEGVISGIIERGFFVMLDGSRIEGLVGFDSMDEFFTVDSSRLKITGRDSGKVMRMGDKVKVIVTDADLDKRQVEMELADQVNKPEAL
jgi:ribonuclease R